MARNPLEEYFNKNKGKLIHKWLHYFDIYDRHFSKYRKQPVTILEFGVFQGGSLQMWRKYFGRKARIIGVDINPKCKTLEEKGIEIYIGDQADRAFLKKLMKKVGPVDVVIEDGGHKMDQQINTFEEVYPYVKDGGIFLIEDLHTSYWADYDGGYRKRDSFIEYAKDIIDDINAYHSRDKESFQVNKNTKSISGMHVYDSIIVFDKATVKEPSHKKTGHKTIGWEE
jgi:cephalosporin hydroxylase